MSRWRTVLFSAAFMPALLLQANFAGCFPSLVGGDVVAGGGGGGGFNLPPSAVITVDRQSGIAPLTVQFSSSTSNDDGIIVQRRWNFGNGQTSPDISPRITFEQTGTFTVTLQLTDDDGATSMQTISIVVTESPVAVFNVDRTASQTAPAIFNFDASDSFDPDGDIAGYRWDFGDGSRELLPVVAHTFSSPGTYRVVLTVTDNAGITATASRIIDVGIPQPRASFRHPPASVRNLVLSQDSPLWVSADTTVSPGVPSMTRVGLDGDRDPCDAKSVAFTVAEAEEIGAFEGVNDEVTDVAISPNGQFVLSGSADGTIDIFNAATSRRFNKFSSNHGGVTAVAFAPNNEQIAVAHENGIVEVRQRASGAAILTLNGHTGRVNDVTYSRDGTRIATAGDDGVAIVWNAANGAEIVTFAEHASAVTSVAFSPVNTTQIVSGSVDQTAKLWNSTSGSLIGQFQPVFAGGDLVMGHNNAITSVAFSPDGTRVVTGSDDRLAIVWNASNFSSLFELSGHSGRVTSVDYAPDGATIITGSFDQTARLWSAETGEFLRRVTPCASRISAVAFSADSSFFVVGVAAQNDIDLDTLQPSGNDVDVSFPQAFSLESVPPGQYSLWIEVDTDRTAPTRVYSSTTVNVIQDFTAAIDAQTPVIPLLNDNASIVVSPTSRRQVFDVGSLAVGDEIRVQILEMPGYGKTYDANRYSVLLLDSSQEMFAWYQNDFVLFTPAARPIVADATSNMFFVIDTGTSVEVTIRRAVGTQQRMQRVYLDFRGKIGVGVGSVPP
ncbi:MAG: PKD domain-containing protein, partial [Phycisphaerae bacterium]